MGSGKLYVRASVWNECILTRAHTRHVDAGAIVGWNHAHSHPHAEASTNLALLVMEGEAPDRSDGGGVIADALYRAVLTRGLRMATDLEHIDMRPIHGWKVLVSDTGSLTLRWPRRVELFQDVPLDIPLDWWRAAHELRIVMVLVGCDLGLHGHVAGEARTTSQLVDQAARNGALAAGAVALEQAS